MSPMADGPLKYVGSLENENMRLEHVTQNLVVHSV